jgi:hypothetical protein
MTKADRKKLLSEIKRMRSAGEDMAILCFNFALCFNFTQSDECTRHLRKTFDDCRKNWDDAIGMLDTSKL